MIAALLLVLASQDVPAPPAEEENEEIVVRATYGTTTMLFDKGADNKLRNCRVMVSSGSQRRDTNACQATPVCFAKTADVVVDCIELTVLEPATIGAARSGANVSAPQIFEMPKLVQPRAAPLPNAIGPSMAPPSSNDPDKQRMTKLPPPPQDKSHEPVIRIGNAEDK